MNFIRMSVLAFTILFLSYGLQAYGLAVPEPLEPGTLFGSAHEFCGDGGAGPSTLYLIDPDTADTTEIGPIGFNAVTGLAFLPDGRLVGSARADANGNRISILIEIDLTTGQGALIGVIGNNSNPGECGRVPDLHYDPFTDTLFGIGDRCPTTDDDSLLRIDTNTGAGTIVGKTGFTSGDNGLAMRQDNPLAPLFAINGNDLYIVIKNTGAALLRFDNVADASALSYHPITNVLYGSDSGGELLTIDTVAGTDTTVGEAFEDCFDALEFVPLPFRPNPIPTLSEWGLIAMAGVLGIIGLLALRRRKVTA